MIWYIKENNFEYLRTLPSPKVNILINLAIQLIFSTILIRAGNKKLKGFIVESPLENPLDKL